MIVAVNVWLHCSFGRASHWYRRGHEFESRGSPDFFQASFQLLKINWKINYDDHSSLSLLFMVVEVVWVKRLEKELCPNGWKFKRSKTVFYLYFKL